MTHGFVIGASKDDLSKLVPLSSLYNGELTLTSVLCYVEFGVHFLEYVAGAEAMRTKAAIVPVVVMDSIEVVDGPIDDLVRYSRVCCTQVLSY